MAASPQVVDATPLFLTANTLVHNARDFRRVTQDIIGQGVCDYDSFRVRQRAAGANMSVDIQTASVANRAYVRGSLTTDAGHYRVYFNSATQTNLDVATADASNPRIDSVYLCIEDSQEVVGNSRASVRMVTGTPTGGATLDNRTGAGSAPANMSSFLLCDILVAAAAASIANAVIRDRRPFCCEGTAPPLFTAVDAVTFRAAPGIMTTSQQVQNTANFDSQQAAALMWLPRRILAATKIRWHYSQSATANTGNYNIGIYDASGRLIISTGVVAYTGTASQQVTHSDTITATTFDAGAYYVVLANGAGTASAIVSAWSCNQASGNAPSGPNLFAFSATGGTTLPTTLAAFTDSNSVTGAAVANRAGVPIITLSVG